MNELYGSSNDNRHAMKCVYILSFNGTSRVAHPSCIQMSDAISAHAKRYDWECAHCKSCAYCDDPGDEVDVDNMHETIKLLSFLSTV